MKRTVAFFVLSLVACAFLAPGSARAVDGNGPEDVQEAEILSPEEAYHALDDRFSTDKNGVVTDSETGLQWYEGPDKDTTWHEAKAWVENLSIDGGGWRMPRREDVKSLYKRGAGTGNMSPLFKTSGGFVWTGETVSTSHAWGFCFDIGADYWPRRTFCDTARAFAVRENKKPEANTQKP
jgi:hypothetical protein